MMCVTGNYETMAKDLRLGPQHNPNYARPILIDPSMADFVLHGGTHTLTLHPETEIVESRYDEARRLAVYVVARGGNRWTVALSLDELNKHGANKMARRSMLANAVAQAMIGPCDVPLASEDVTP